MTVAARLLGQAKDFVADAHRHAPPLAVARDKTADPLTKQGDGTWTITRKLPPGTYGYKFVVNGTTWKQDEANPEAKDDGFGGKNSVVTVK